MTVEEIFNDLSCKYSNAFNWSMVPLKNKTLVEELKREICSDHFLYHKLIWAVAKCDSNDDVLYVTDDEVYYIIHLTYSLHNADEYPKCKEFTSIGEVKSFLEQSFCENYL